MDLSIYEKKREELIDDEVMHLISSKGKFNPFTKEHINEALMEFSDEQLDDISRLLQDVRSVYRLSSETFEMLGSAIWCYIFQYWENMAKEQAENETPSAYELWLDGRAEAADARYEALRDARMGL